MTNGRDGTTPGPEMAAVQRLADHLALVADQAASDADRGMAREDQAASDADRAASERDDSDATRDQRSADLDQATADEIRAGRADAARDEAYESTRAARAASRIDRLATHANRSTTDEARLGAARGRDRNASRRDDTARRREERALLVEEAIAGSDAPVQVRFARLREQAAKERADAAADRVRAAAERTEAAAERASLVAELHGAFLDDLTGAFRREVGRHALALEMVRARWADGSFVLACIDVDGLKGINDRAGRETGDFVLRTLVATIRSSLRPYDPIVRVDGDEFACGIGGAGIDEVVRRFDQVAGSLHADTGVGISVGMVALADGETIEQVTARADAALDDAKRSRQA